VVSPDHRGYRVRASPAAALDRGVVGSSESGGVVKERVTECQLTIIPLFNTLFLIFMEPLEVCRDSQRLPC
jgi:hypothetical protein